MLSRSTRRIDEGEKKDAYLTIPTLEAYVLVETESASAVIDPRTAQGFDYESVEGLNGSLELPGGVVLPLAEMYRNIEFTPEPEPE